MRSDVATRWGVIAISCICLFPLAQRATAGQGDAGIIGQMRDESGAILPGVTVTAKSPALQVQSVSDVTDARGEYRLIPLPIGTYTVDYELSGFQTVRQENLRLTVGFVAKVDVVLKVGALAETITVSGAAPLVDVTSTANSTHLTKESLELIPNSRNGVIGVLSQAPGVRTVLDVGGDSVIQPVQSRVFGQVGEPNYYTEGIFTPSADGAAFGGQYLDYNIIEEAEVQTVGSDAEYPHRGAVVNMAVKSGGNAFHGNYFSAFTNGKLQVHNITPQLAAQGVASGNRVDWRADASADLGGRIIKDKLWFYGAFRDRGQNIEAFGVLKPDGTPGVVEDRHMFFSGKSNYQLNASNRLIGFYQWANKKQTGQGISPLLAYESRTGPHTRSHSGKIEWQAVPTSTLVLSLQYGHWGNWNDRPNFAGTKPASRDVVTQMVWGQPVSGNTVIFNTRHHTKGSLSWYKSDLFAGNHNIKAGFDHMVSTRPATYTAPTPNYQLVFSNGAAFQMQTSNTPLYPHSATHYAAVYVKDSWTTAARRLTLNLGVRYAHDNGFVNAGCSQTPAFPGNLAFPGQCYPFIQFPIWNAVAPRLHAAWDVAGDGRTVVKGGYGRYNHMRQIEEFFNPLGRKDVLYKWNDLNGNKDWDAGESNLDPTGTDFVSLVSAVSNGVPNPNEKEVTSEEFSLGLERQIAKNLSFRIIGVHSRTFNVQRLQNNLRPYSSYNVPITRPDPGPDGRVGTADDPGTSFTYYEYPTTLRGLAFEQSMYINDPNADQRFNSFEVGTVRRFANGAQFMASYAATKRNIPLLGGLAETNLLYRGGPFTPNAEINTSDHNWESTGKLSGSYRLPYAVQISGNFEHRTGDPWARQVLFSGGVTIPTIVLNVEPIGTRRLPSVNLVDMRAEKRFRLALARTVTVRMNVYNLTNASPIQTINQRSGPTFGQPLTVMLPRIAEFSVSYAF